MSSVRNKRARPVSSAPQYSGKLLEESAKSEEFFLFVFFQSDGNFGVYSNLETIEYKAALIENISDNLINKEVTLETRGWVGRILNASRSKKDMLEQCELKLKEVNDEIIEEPKRCNESKTQRPARVKFYNKKFVDSDTDEEEVTQQEAAKKQKKELKSKQHLEEERIKNKEIQTSKEISKQIQKMNSNKVNKPNNHDNLCGDKELQSSLTLDMENLLQENKKLEIQVESMSKHVEVLTKERDQAKQALIQSNNNATNFTEMKNKLFVEMKDVVDNFFSSQYLSFPNELKDVEIAEPITNEKVPGTQNLYNIDVVPQQCLGLFGSDDSNGMGTGKETISSTKSSVSQQGSDHGDMLDFCGDEMFVDTPVEKESNATTTSLMKSSSVARFLITAASQQEEKAKKKKKKKVAENILQLAVSATRTHLKHQKPAEGLTELIEGTQIYISEKTLYHLLQHAKTFTGLARNLVVGIYTEDAIAENTCKGDPRGQRDQDKMLGGLHPAGISAIRDFVKEVCDAKIWKFSESRFTRAINQVCEENRNAE